MSVTEQLKSEAGQGNFAVKPITGGDVEAFRTQFKLTVADLCAALNITRGVYGAAINNRDEPLSDPQTAILLRIYTQFPEAVPLKRDRSIGDLWVFMGGEEVVGPRLLAQLIGREPTAGHRYHSAIKRGEGRDPGRGAVSRLVEALMKVGDGRVALEMLARAAEEEGFARGIDVKKVKGWGKAAYAAMLEPSPKVRITAAARAAKGVKKTKLSGKKKTLRRKRGSDE